MYPMVHIRRSRRPLVKPGTPFACQGPTNFAPPAPPPEPEPALTENGVASLQDEGMPNLNVGQAAPVVTEPEIVVPPPPPVPAGKAKKNADARARARKPRK